jgi:hypothetical protein
MKPYFVEGKISININVEIEADSLEDAEKKAFELFKDDHPLYYYMESIDENHSLRPVMWNSFNRMTLVNKIDNERLTLDFDLTFKWEDHIQNFNNLIIAELKQETVNRNSAFFALMKTKCIRPYRLSKYCIGSIELYGGSILKFNNFKKKLLKLKKINTHAA